MQAFNIFSIILIVFIIIIFCLCIIGKIINALKRKEKYSDENYVVTNSTENKETDSSSITYHSSNMNHSANKTIQVFQAIYLCVFTIIWISILTTIIIFTNSKGFNLINLIFIPFILVAFFLIITTIKAFISVFKKNKNNIKKSNSINEFTSENQNFIKICNNCGSDLRQYDKFCPFCGKEAK